MIDWPHLNLLGSTSFMRLPARTHTYTSFELAWMEFIIKWFISDSDFSASLSWVEVKTWKIIKSDRWTTFCLSDFLNFEAAWFYHHEAGCVHVMLLAKYSSISSHYKGWREVWFRFLSSDLKNERAILHGRWHFQCFQWKFKIHWTFSTLRLNTGHLASASGFAALADWAIAVHAPLFGDGISLPVRHLEVVGRRPLLPQYVHPLGVPLRHERGERSEQIGHGVTRLGRHLRIKCDNP